MRITQSLGSVSRLAGGLFFSVRHLSTQLTANGVEVAVLSFEDSHSGEDLAAWQPVQPRVFKPAWPRSFRYSTAFRQALEQSRPDILHTQGVWQYPSIVALGWKRRSGKPHVASPRGMLEPWAWQHQAWKKRPVWWAWERRNLGSATVLHATSNQEAQQLRALGLTQPIAVVPNGVPLPPHSAFRIPHSAFEDSALRNPHSAIRTALFLSRIHPKKGLLNLVRAWALVKAEMLKTETLKEESGKQGAGMGWRMLVCGPDEGGHLEEVRAEVRRQGVDDSFEFVGEVYGEAKERLLGTADLFILPTHSENFGLVVAEALAASVPVITTKAAPWGELEKHQCGWWIELGVEPLAAALRSATALTDEQRQAMGRRGRELVERCYAWPALAREMKTVYDWVLGAGPRPGCILGS